MTNSQKPTSQNIPKLAKITPGYTTFGNTLTIVKYPRRETALDKYKIVQKGANNRRFRNSEKSAKRLKKSAMKQGCCMTFKPQGALGNFKNEA